MGFIAARRAEKTAESEFDAFEVVAAQVVDVIATAGVVLDQANTLLGHRLEPFSLVWCKTAD
jgi:two-component system, OmpR family, sensor histidine kinase SenX3